MAELTPMMQQYFEIKNKNKDYILFYRLGDYAEPVVQEDRIRDFTLVRILHPRRIGIVEHVLIGRSAALARAALVSAFTPSSNLAMMA